jgi:hypothetical protein
MKLKIALVLLFVGVLVGCQMAGTAAAVTGNKNYRSFTIGFNANPGQGTLNTNTPNKGCTAGNGQGPGCIAFKKGITGTVTVYIKGATIDEECALVGPPNYVITQIKVTDQQVVNTEKGEFPPDPASADWMQAAFPTIDMATGVVYQVDYNKGATPSAAFINNNAHDAGLGVKNVWYHVTATKCDNSGATLVSDPRIRNYGK